MFSLIPNYGQLNLTSLMNYVEMWILKILLNEKGSPTSPWDWKRVLFPKFIHRRILFNKKWQSCVKRDYNAETDPFQITVFQNAIWDCQQWRKQRSIPTVHHFTVNLRYPNYWPPLCRVSGYRSRGPGFDSLPYHIFWELGGLERGPLSLGRTIEELHEWKSSGSGLAN
jgi:hypothetical protein